LGLLERQAQTQNSSTTQKIQNRSSLQELAQRRSTILQNTSQQAHELYQTLEGLRDARSRGMEKLITLEVLREGLNPPAASSPEAALSALQQRQEEVIHEIDATIVRAPARGVILTLAARVGDALLAQAVLGSLSSAQPKMTIETPEELPLLSVGQFADVLVAVADGSTQHFAGEVEEIDRSHSGQTNLTVVVRSPDQFLEMNPSSATVIFTNATPKPVLAVAQSAVVTAGKKSVVFVVSGNTQKVVERPVVVGFHGDDGWVEIQEGLTTGEVILAHP